MPFRLLTLSGRGFQKLAQDGEGDRFRSPVTELSKIWCGQIQSYDKSLCKISSVLVKKWRHNDTINFFSLWYMGIWTFCHYDVKMTSYIKILMNLNSGPKNSPMWQIWAWSSNYLGNNSSLFVFSTQKNDVTYWKQKVAMATSYYNGYWQNTTQKVRQRSKVKVRKLLFNISWRFAVMEEKL